MLLLLRDWEEDMAENKKVLAPLKFEIKLEEGGLPEANNFDRMINLQISGIRDHVQDLSILHSTVSTF